jgi:hypothetical protein
MAKLEQDSLIKKRGRTPCSLKDRMRLIATKLNLNPKTTSDVKIRQEFLRRKESIAEKLYD